MLRFGKIGRNLVNFQRFERMLKLVIVQSDVRGCASKLAKAHRDRGKDTDRKPLGWLVEEFFKTFYWNGFPNDGLPDELDEVWMSICVGLTQTKTQFAIESVNSPNSSQREMNATILGSTSWLGLAHSRRANLKKSVARVAHP